MKLLRNRLIIILLFILIFALPYKMVSQNEKIFKEIYSSVAIDNYSRLFFGHSTHSVDKYTLLDEYIIYYSAFERKIFLLNRKNKEQVDVLNLDKIRGIKYTKLENRHANETKKTSTLLLPSFFFYDINEEYSKNKILISYINTRKEGQHLVLRVKNNKLKYDLLNVHSNFSDNKKAKKYESTYLIVNDSLSVFVEKNYYTNEIKEVQLDYKNKITPIYQTKENISLKKIGNNKFAFISKNINSDSLFIYENDQVISKLELCYNDSLSNVNSKNIYFDKYTNNLYVKTARDTIGYVYQLNLVNIKKNESQIKLKSIFRINGYNYLTFENDTVYFLKNNIDGNQNYLYSISVKEMQNSIKNMNTNKEHFTDDAFVLSKFENIEFPSKKLKKEFDVKDSTYNQSSIKELLITTIELLNKDDLLSVIFNISAYDIYDFNGDLSNLTDLILDNKLNIKSEQSTKANKNMADIYNFLLSNYKSLNFENSNNIYTCYIEDYRFKFYKKDSRYYLLGYSVRIK